MAISVSQRWHDAARVGARAPGAPSPDAEPGNPFLASGGGGGGGGGGGRSGGGGPANPFLAGPSSGGGDNPFMAPAGPRGRSGAGNGVQMDTGSLTRSLLAAGRPGGGGPGAASEAAAQMLGSLLEGASQVGDNSPGPACQGCVP
jgi:hypothetical protein